jgi:hypothetical protein
MRLPLYEGALRRRLEIELNEKNDNGGTAPTQDDSGYTPGQTMSMAEALSSSSGDDTAKLMALNSESSKSLLGPMFEYEKA